MATEKTKKPKLDLDTFKELLYSRRAKKVTRTNSASLYSYIYDSGTQDKKYSRDLSVIENRLTDLGLTGKIHRLSRFKNLKEIIEDDARAGARNVIILGNDETFLRSLMFGAADSLCFGFIPFIEKSEVARLLGIADRFDACQALGARLIESLDLGRVGGHTFLSSLKIPHCRAEIVCDNNFRVSSLQDRNLEIFNLHLPKNEEDKLDFLPNPRDGKLELVIRKLNKLSIFGGWRYAMERVGRDSLFFFRAAQVVSREPIVMLADGKKIIQSNPKIEVVPKALKLIVGRKRLI